MNKCLVHNQARAYGSLPSNPPEIAMCGQGACPFHKSNCHGFRKYFSAHGEGLTLFTLKAHLQYRIQYSKFQYHVLFLVHQTKFNHSHWLWRINKFLSLHEQPSKCSIYSKLRYSVILTTFLFQELVLNKHISSKMNKIGPYLVHILS